VSSANGVRSPFAWGHVQPIRSSKQESSALTITAFLMLEICVSVLTISLRAATDGVSPSLRTAREAFRVANPVSVCLRSQFNVMRKSARAGGWPAQCAFGQREVALALVSKQRPPRAVARWQMSPPEVGGREDRAGTRCSCPSASAPSCGSSRLAMLSPCIGRCWGRSHQERHSSVAAWSQKGRLVTQSRHLGGHHYTCEAAPVGPCHISAAVGAPGGCSHSRSPCRPAGCNAPQPAARAHP
jgi:hypothetical protein